MPVISPRRTSTTTSGNLYIPPSTTSASGLSSSIGKSITPSSSTSGYSSTYRSSSLSKPASPSYSSSLSYSTGSYLPRTSAYRSSGGGITTGGNSSHGSSSLSGGSSYLSTYRQNSYLSSSNNDSISSRFGVSRTSSFQLSRSYSDKDLCPQHPFRRRSFSKTLDKTENSNICKNDYNNIDNCHKSHFYDNLTRKYATTHTTTRPLSINKKTSDSKPPICGGSRPRSSSLRNVASPALSNNNLNVVKRQKTSNHSESSSLLKSSSLSSIINPFSKCDQNTNCNNNNNNRVVIDNCNETNQNDINVKKSFQTNPNTTTKTNLQSSTLGTTITAITTTSTTSTSLLNDYKTNINATNHHHHHHHHHQLQLQQRKSNLENNIGNHDGIKTSSLSSSSPSSLARLVATSGLDLYEKYSPAHYIPKCELSRSRSVSEATSMSKNATFATDNNSSHNITTRENNTNLPLDSGRYNRINNFNNSKRGYINSDNEYNSSNGNNSIRTRNGLTPLKITNLRVVVDADGNDDDADDDDKDYDDVDGSVNGKNSITPRSHLRDLKISSYSADDEQDLANTSFATVQLDIKKRNDVVVVVQNKAPLTNCNKTTTTLTTTANTNINKLPAQIGNQKFFLISAFKDQNFLKSECELARAQVIRQRSRSLSRKKSIDLKKKEDEATKILNDVCCQSSNSDTQEYDLVGGNDGDDDYKNNNNSNRNNSNSINNNNKSKNKELNENRLSMQHTSTNASLGNKRICGKNVINNKISIGDHFTAHENVVTSKVTKLTHKLTGAAEGGVNSVKTGIHLGSTTSKLTPIKPLVHRSIISSNNKYLTKLLNNTSSTIATSSNNNMNCLENNSELLDEIKYIDSDDMTSATTADRNNTTTMTTTLKTQKIYHQYYHNNHHHNHSHQQQQQDNKKSQLQATGAAHKLKLRPKSSIVSSSNQNLFEKVNNYKFVNGTILNAGATSGNSNKSATTTSSTTTARRRDFISHSETNDIKASIEKFNTLNELKRMPTFNKVNSGSASNLQHYQQHTQKQSINNSNNTYDNDNNINYNNHGGGTSLTRSLNRNSVAGSIVASKVIANLYSSPSPSTTASNSSSIGGSTGSICSGTLTNNYGLAKINGIKSTEASPSNSPQHLRKPTKGLINVNPIALSPTPPSATKANESASTTNVVAVSIPSAPFSSLPVVALKSITSTVTTATATATSTSLPTITSSSSSSLSSPSNSSNDKKSNKLCDISIRNASIRNALPPASPTPSRYWDRDREGSNRFAVSRDDYSKSSTSALSNSSADEKSQSEGLCGLRNIGNTCFMNSVIQCLSHTNELTRFLKTQNTIRSTSTKDQQILYEFAKLIREMWTAGVRSVTPMELKRAFSSKHRMYSDYNQQDAQEFLRFFLDSLHSALNSGTKGEQLKLDDSMSDNKKADLTWDWYSKQENSLIRDLFVGQLKSTLKCTTCGNTSVTFDPFWDLSVPLPSSSRCKLDACLDFFIREEVLDGDEMPTCSKCKTRRKCTKSFRIQRFPRYLVIHLKRFSETRWSKMSNIVEFPTGERELNMGPYGSNSSTNVYYSLYAISNHMGSTAGGHYVALCKHPVNKKWHEFNDNVVSDDLSESHLVSSSAYILFYERAQRKSLSQLQFFDSANGNVLCRRKAVNGKKKKKQRRRKKKNLNSQQQQHQRWKQNQRNDTTKPSTDHHSAASLLMAATTNHQLKKLILNASIGILFYAFICALCYYVFV